MRILSRAILPTVCLGLLALAGCGGTPSSLITGEVTFGGSPIPEGDQVTINLDGIGTSFSATPDASGKFTVAKIANGTYKVNVTHYVAAANTPKGKMPSPPVTKEYPDTWTVPGGPFKIDMSRVK